MRRLLVVMVIMSGWGFAGCVVVTKPSGAQQALAQVKAQLALGYMAQGQGQEALRQINAAVDLAPVQPQLWLLRAQLYGQHAQPQEAEESYLKALSVAPLDGAANHFYGWYLCQTTDRRAEAVAYLDRAMADRAYEQMTQVRMHRQSCMAQTK